MNQPENVLFMSKSDKQLCIFLGVLFMIGIGYYLFSSMASNSHLEKECEEKVIYNPASEREGALGKSKSDEHYTFTGKSFKTKIEAMDYCMDRQILE